MQPNQHLTDLVHILKQQGVRHVIICPGSRNAPLIQLFTRDSHFTCYSIVDERSAGYVGLGMAKEENAPVVVLTTSGTASLNLGPSVAEAFFQKIPLIVLTADRPREWPPQFSNQIVNQDKLFAANSKASYSLPIHIENDDTLKVVLEKCKEIIKSAEGGLPGPVHLNIPLKEPLYDAITDHLSDGLTPAEEGTEQEKMQVSAETQNVLSEFLKEQQKVLIIAGADRYTAVEELLLVALSIHYNVVIIAENITNLKAPHFINQPELIFASTSDSHKELEPELIVTLGGQVVSKKTRLFVQARNLIPVLVLDFFPEDLFSELTLNIDVESEYKYLSEWKRIEKEALEKLDIFLTAYPFSNFTALGGVLNTIPEHSVVHLGNSSTIRISQLFPQRNDLRYYGNRGTSGIDGSLSSAVGAAMVSKKLHIVILGDLSFVYDSNAMWNRDFPPNLKIIVINDGGGGIFRILSGPEKMSFFEKFSVTNHPVSHLELSKAFGLTGLQVVDYKGLNKGLEALFEEEDGPDVIEIFTAKSENSSIFKKFYKSLQKE